MVTKKPELIGIKAEPVKNVLGSYKYSKSDWTMVAYLIPRAELRSTFSEKELQYNGIYFLFGRRGLTEQVYVGQAKERNQGGSVLKRLRDHDDSLTEKYSDIWNYAIVITSEKGDWGPTELNILENRFYHEIPADNRLNGVEPNKGGKDDSQDYEEKVRQAKALLSVIGLTVFDVDEETENQIPTIEYNEPTVVEDLHHKMARIPEIITPQRTVKAMVDMLPIELFNPYTKFFDPACKGGEYLREIRDRLMKSESMIAEFQDPFIRYMYILENQLFGVALSRESFDRASRNLYGTVDKVRNIKIINNYTGIINKIKKSGNKSELYRKMIEREFGVMKFDVVIGNPPYQETTGAGINGGKAIYDSFIELGLKISDKVCMIVKNNWMNSDSLKDLRDTILNNGLKTLVNYSLLGDIFPSMGISASIIYIDKNYHGNIDYTEIQRGAVLNKYCEDIRDIGFIPSSLYEYTIARKVLQASTNRFSNHVIGTNPFGISTDGKISKDEFIDERDTKTDYYNILLRYAKEFSYTNIDCFRKNNELVDSYKIICPKQIHKTSNPIPSVIGLKPNEICSGQYSLLYYSNDAVKATNVASYINTKFFRFLVNCLADTLCAFTAYRVSLVPDQDFSLESDIDWKQSISDIDKQLYAKYNLTEEEISYIEKTIKAMPGANQSFQPSNPKLDIQAYEAAAMNMALKKS